MSRTTILLGKYTLGCIAFMFASQSIITDALIKDIHKRWERESAIKRIQAEKGLDQSDAAIDYVITYQYAPALMADKHGENK